MSAIRLRGATSGTTDVVAAAIAGDGVLSLPSGTGTLATAAYVDAAVAAGGKVLQVVRATDVTNRSTTSTSFVDVTGMSVTITPTKSTSAVLIIAVFLIESVRFSTNITTSFFQITDTSNTAISGSEGQTIRLEITGLSATFQIYQPVTLFAYATPATLSAVTYKLRQKSAASTSTTVVNTSNTGQMFAIEVAE